MLLVPRSMILVTSPVRRARWKRSDSWCSRLEHVLGQHLHRALAHPLEHHVADVVEQHGGEARGGIGEHQRQRGPHQRLAARLGQLVDQPAHRDRASNSTVTLASRISSSAPGRAASARPARSRCHR